MRGGFWRKASYRLGWMLFRMWPDLHPKQDPPCGEMAGGCKLGSSCISATAATETRPGTFAVSPSLHVLEHTQDLEGLPPCLRSTFQGSKQPVYREFRLSSDSLECECWGCSEPSDQLLLLSEPSDASSAKMKTVGVLQFGGCYGTERGHYAFRHVGDGD